MSPKSAPPAPRGNPNRVSHRHASTPGFTLVELLVVIGIIAILIGLLVTVIPKIRKAAWKASTSSELSAISNAIQQYYGDFKAYPGPLPNNQVGSAYDPNGPVYPFGGGYQMTGMSTAQLTHISGTQNMTLGLLGGLELQYNTNQGVSGFIYNPLDIFPDGSHPGPVGAGSLNANNPRRQQSYLQVKQGDISTPVNGHSFADAGNRSPNDSPIPVFLDKYSDPLPILYIRTNVGGQAIVGVRNTDGNGAQLQDPTASGYTVAGGEVPQYDLAQVFDYTQANFGTILNSKYPYHGLQGIGNQNLAGGTVDTIASGYANQGKNGVAYFRDPNFVVNATGSYDPLADNRHAGVPREKNGYLLITAGDDRAYGTPDDNIFPGTLQVAQ